MHLAVVCNEDAPFFDLPTIAADNAGSYLGSAPALRYVEACRGWPRADVPAADRAPVSSNVPVLLLSGEVDPVTPPSNAAAAARTLPNSLQITVPGEGHGALQRSCTRRIVGDFLERASVAGLSTDCLRDAKPTRFFTTFAGPQP
jgi:pimeloyl-ACP methyl ester carboxylesterase